MSRASPLPLHYETPAAWAATAFSDVLALLNDHAYLERKAASNALELLNRWPAQVKPDKWVDALAAVARDEALHLQQVTRILRKRGGALDRKHKAAYAADLRALVRVGVSPHDLLDRLLVSGLIEARSCERFGLLAKAAPDTELASFYRGLWASEAGHYQIFLDLAEQVVTPAERDARWRALVAEEARIIQAQPPGPMIHSGVGTKRNVLLTITTNTI